MTHVPTISGRWIDLADMRPEDVDLGDIAYHLAGQNRFNGGTEPFGYSVAEHSVRVAWKCRPSLRRAGLLHDAAEAYVGDLVSPIKAADQTFRAFERAAWKAIALRFGLPGLPPPEVEEADKRMCATEIRDLCPRRPAVWALPAEPYDDFRLTAPWSFTSARQTFLGVAEELGLR